MAWVHLLHPIASAASRLVLFPDLRCNIWTRFFFALPQQLMLSITDYSYSSVITFHCYKDVIISHGFIAAMWFDDSGALFKTKTSGLLVGFDDGSKVGSSIGEFDKEYILAKRSSFVLKGNVLVRLEVRKEIQITNDHRTYQWQITVIKSHGRNTVSKIKAAAHT